MESLAQGYAVANIVPLHLDEVRKAKLAVITKTEMAVKECLTKEINHWDHHAEVLRGQKRAGKSNAKLNSGEAGNRADNLEARLKNDLKN